MAGRIPVELVDEFLRDCVLLSNRELAQKYQRAVSTIKEWKQSLRDMGYVVPIRTQPDTLQLESPLVIQDPNALVISDLQIPYLNVELFSLAIRIGVASGVKRVIVAGDILNLDTISSWPQLTPPPSLKEELYIARERLEELCMNFSEVYCIMGNHDARFVRHLQGELSLADLGLPGKWSQHWYCYLGRWMIVHPDGATSFRSLQDMADTYQSHVIAGHTHLWGMTKSRSGLYEVVQIGCMCDESRIPYMALKRHRGPRWIGGFAVIQENICYLYDEERARRKV
ncbi:MAG: metallophosphoesterase family protein [Candidatus Methanomethylicaceae archaeon]